MIVLDFGQTKPRWAGEDGLGPQPDLVPRSSQLPLVTCSLTPVE